MKGQDVAFKDVIEPLESVSVSIIKTDKTTLAELGTADEVRLVCQEFRRYSLSGMFANCTISLTDVDSIFLS